jgi:hypothetical protein
MSREITMQKILMGAALTAAMIFGSGAAVADDASPQAGAKPIKQAFNEKDCHEWSWGATKYKRCVDRKGHWHRVVTPSNNYKYTYKFKAAVTYWRDGKQIHSTTSDRKFFRLVKKGQTHVLKSKYKSEREYNSGGTCVSVSYSYEYQWVGGKMVRKKNSYDVTKCN